MVNAQIAQDSLQRTCGELQSRSGRKVSLVEQRRLSKEEKAKENSTSGVRVENESFWIEVVVIIAVTLKRDSILCLKTRRYLLCTFKAYILTLLNFSLSFSFDS